MKLGKKINGMQMRTNQETMVKLQAIDGKGKVLYDMEGEGILGVMWGVKGKDVPKKKGVETAAVVQTYSADMNLKPLMELLVDEVVKSVREREDN